MTDPLRRVIERVRECSGVDLSGYRRSTLEKRLADRLEQVHARELGDYLHRLEGDADECDRLLGVLAVHVSSFFRDPVVFELLEQAVLPAIVAEKAERGARDLRVWSAGCGAGEEAYSAAVLVARAVAAAHRPLAPLVFGTDINAESLHRATAGVYPREQLGNVKLGLLDRYFRERDGRFEVAAEVRAFVRFSLDDLTKPGVTAPAESVYGGFDLVLCRNVLIYFEDALQEAVLSKLSASLAPRGFLVLGTAEQPCGPAKGDFDVIDGRNRIYRKKGEAHRGTTGGGA